MTTDQSKLKRKQGMDLKTINNYIVLGTLGFGSYAKVKKVCSQIDNSYSAMKCVNGVKVAKLFEKEMLC